MKISGFNKRRISTVDNDTKLAYDISFFISNTTGEAFWGISGYTGTADSAANSKKTQFTFKSGRIFDPENRCSSSYKQNELVNIKGTFLTGSYDYFVNENLICSIGSKENFKIRDFFFESKGCEIGLEDFKIISKKGSLKTQTQKTFPVFGSSGSSGFGNKSTSGSSGKDATITLPNTLTFNSGLSLAEGDILSGQVVVGSGDFKFDNSASNLAYLSGVSAGTKKDLKLVSKIELERKEYPLIIDYYTTFGNFSQALTLEGKDPYNPSGIGINMGISSGDHDLLTTGETFSLQGSGDIVSGLFDISYSASNMGSTESSLGLPYKIYLEHVSGDHSKNYSYITGVKISGVGLGYDSDNFENLGKSLTFRTGKSGASPSTLTGESFGAVIKDAALGLASYSSGYDTTINEAHMESIRTNLHTGSSAGSGTFSTVSGVDKALFTSYENVVDIVSLFEDPDSSTASTKVSATGIPMVFSYTKPASDWALFTGSAMSEVENMVNHSLTGVTGAPLLRHKYTGGNSNFLRIGIKTKNYLDQDPMVYNFVFSGADGFIEKIPITGTIMGTGYDVPYEPKL